MPNLKTVQGISRLSPTPPAYPVGFQLKRRVSRQLKDQYLKFLSATSSFSLQLQVSAAILHELADDGQNYHSDCSRSATMNAVGTVV
jgi:predicted lysophospholipase L1 biosynthesis ABC-type transport system permease subunit